MSIPEKLKPYRDLGLVFTSDNGKNASTTCPFCDKEDHFNVNIETGLWRCVRCDEDGNEYSFIQKLYDASNGLTHEYLAQSGMDVETACLQLFDPELVEDRGLSPAALQYMGVKHSLIDARWLIPIYNWEGVLSNLGIWTETTDDDNNVKRVVYYVSGMKQYLYGLDQLHRWDEIQRPDVIWIVEGPWDRGATFDVLSRVRDKSINQTGRTLTETTIFDKSLMANALVLARPSAHTFSSGDAEALKRRFPNATQKIMVVGDNDYPRVAGKTKKVTHPGWDGVVKTASLLQAQAYKNVHVCQWGVDEFPAFNEFLPDGYDLRDECKDDRKVPVTRAGDVLRRMVPFNPKSNPAHVPAKLKKSKEKAEIEYAHDQPIPCDTFEELVAAFKSQLFVPQDLEDALCVMLGAVLSTPYPTDPLWLRVISPPGSGKTTLAESFSAAREFVCPISKMTGIHSGYVENFDIETDNSLMPKIKDKAAIVKDADTIMSSNSCDTILSELRDIFDGDSRSQYRNKSGRDYEDFKTTFILCGTDDLRNMNKTFLGERFLDIEVVAPDADSSPYVMKSIGNTKDRMYNFKRRKKEAAMGEHAEQPVNPTVLSYLRPRVYGFLQHFSSDAVELPQMSDEYDKAIKGLADMVALMRARVNPHLKELGVAARPEYPTRLAAQLTKSALMTGMIYGKKHVDEDVMRVVRKLVIDTCVGNRMRIAKYLYSCLETDRITRKELQVSLGIDEATLARTVRQMEEFKMIVQGKKKNGSGVGGRDSSCVFLSKKLRTAMRFAGVKVEEDGS
jgi:hypothetical protein